MVVDENATWFRGLRGRVCRTRTPGVRCRRFVEKDDRGRYPYDRAGIRGSSSDAGLVVVREQ